MRTVKEISVILLVFIVMAAAYSDATTLTMKPEKVYRFIYVEKPQEWYEEQSILWKQQVVENRKDVNAWYNYFMATRYSSWRGDAESYKQITNGILDEMEQSIPDSYEYNYLRYYNGERDISLLDKAYQVDPKRPDALYEFIAHYEKNGDAGKLKKYCAELYETKDISPGLLNYNYNVLASTEKNAILFTNGDNDSYPAWVLQNKFGIRTDVLVMNLHLTFVDRDYFKRMLSEKGIDLDVQSFSNRKMNVFLADCAKALAKNYPQIPVYTAATVYSESTKNIKENLYLVGLAFKYSMKRFDNIARIKDNLDNNLRLDYLNYDWYGDTYLVKTGLDRLHINYVVAFLKLAEVFHESGHDQEAQKWKEKALRLAEKAENKKFIKHIEELSWK